MLVKYLPVLNETLHRNAEIKVSFLHATRIQEALFLAMTTQGVQENKNGSCRMTGTSSTWYNRYSYFIRYQYTAEGLF